MHVRPVNLERDYPIIKTWWERRGSDAPAAGLLPDLGVIAEMDGAPIACAFLYEDKGGRVGMVEWEATNPECLSAMTTVAALNQVFGYFEWHCRANKIAVVLSWVAEGRGDGRILERRKWVKCPGDRHALMAFSAA